ncbi:hypothetical protein H072_11553 [Dactylellina haptotyla CBS 200.50]|uniref:Acyltransferase 3 domain-containing protein n=1 Tax=Dactylellina haptotyla (strain CBS 200.50) TaxID=1284197 RepID=S8BIH6_DACHA|nr:hypothetical protein H072_11553 [Dactylellina haptotyla CBS 200.50]
MPLRGATEWLRVVVSTMVVSSASKSSSIYSGTEARGLLSIPSLLTATPTLARHSFRSCVHAILPSFLHSPAPSAPLLPGSHAARPSASVHPTAYLDGLRGTAAFLVFIYHFVYAYFPSLEYGFLRGPNDLNPFQLPILRLFMCGASMVSIFFVISGYALSYKTIRMIRRRDHASVLTTLSSSTFRRALRLNIPTLVSVLWVALLIQMGAFTWNAQNVKKGKVLAGWREDDPPILTGFWRQMRDAFWAWAAMSSPFTWKEYFITYDLHLWTIPVEFRCSILVFISLLGLSKVKSWVRMGVLSVMAIASFVYHDRWDVFCFLSGVVLAEVSIIRMETKSKGNNLLLFPVLLVGLHIASMPSHDPGHTPGYVTLSNSIPSRIHEKGRFWQSISAVIIVSTVSFATPSGLQRPFTTGFAQYLGKISYAMYLMHGPICRTLGFWSVVNFWKYTGKDSTTGKFFGVFGGAILVFTVVFWLSDIFWRAVDMGCVKFARWMENACLAKTDEQDEKNFS